MIVYVVFGSEGEFSDKDEYPIAGYRNEEFAKAHVECAERMIDEIQALCRDLTPTKAGNCAQIQAIRASNPYDQPPPKLLSVIEDEVRYWYAPVLIRETVPAPDDAPEEGQLPTHPNNCGCCACLAELEAADKASRASCSCSWFCEDCGECMECYGSDACIRPDGSEGPHVPPEGWPGGGS